MSKDWINSKERKELLDEIIRLGQERMQKSFDRPSLSDINKKK